MIVCIAEKPSVAAEIARIVGANVRREGYFEGNNYCVTYTFGHLCTLNEPHDYDSRWKSWMVSSLPIIPARFGIKLIDDNGISRQFNIIKNLFAQAEAIVNCGDAGQEGELIQRWVMQYAGAKCPVKRLWISSLTDDAIREGFANLRPAADFDRLYWAGLARAAGDWLLGINATRAYTLRYATNRQVLSIGRVQTPTLALIVARHFEIMNFVSAPYWEIHTLYRDVIFACTKGKISTEEEANRILDNIKNDELEITNISEKQATEAPPRLFDLTSLQVECNKKFGYSADETLRIIQSLYEKKLTTYPRVDTTYLPDELYPQIEPTMQRLAASYSTIVEPLLKSKIEKNKRIFDNSKVTDHHAIIPTGEHGTMSQLEQTVYDIVTRRFIANFYPVCKFSVTTIDAQVNDTLFKATGKLIKDSGWRVVYGNDKEALLDEDPEKEKNQALPHFTVGEHGVHKPQIVQRQTTPPKPYTEATLLRAMETAGKNVDDEALRLAMKENGIGRPSTRAAIIETLFKRNYIKKIRKSLIPTEIGINLIQTISHPLIKSPALTGEWEYKLRLIERGEYDTIRFMNELKEMVREVTNNALTDNSHIRIGAQTVASQLTQKSNAKKAQKAQQQQITPGTACPLCGKGIVIKGSRMYGCSRWNEGCNWRAPFPEATANDS